MYRSITGFACVNFGGNSQEFSLYARKISEEYLRLFPSIRLSRVPRVNIRNTSPYPPIRVLFVKESRVPLRSVLCGGFPLLLLLCLAYSFYSLRFYLDQDLAEGVLRCWQAARSAG